MIDSATKPTGVFDSYAAYYDLLYRDKDYAAEADYVHNLIQRYAPGTRTLLEFGCGTGSHAIELMRYGYQVRGIDRSAAMVGRAREKTKADTVGERPEFIQGDLLDYRAGRTFDAVLALFHVVSYQTENVDLQRTMRTAAEHLEPGGLFIFDCWYGPGVLTDPPVTRVRRMHGDDIKVTRIAEPVHYPNQDRVDVHYDVLVERAGNQERIHEVHAMRYLFVPEVDLILQMSGLKRLACETWLDGREPDSGSWNVCFVATR